MVALRNAGNNVDALMVEQLPDWPVADPVKMWSFPLVQKIDLYNDGLMHLLASPFDPSLVKSQGTNSVWLYSDCKSSSGAKDCGLLTRSFLQDGMIDLGLGAYPVFVDVNGDGLTDLVVGNYGLYDSCLINEFGQLKCYYTARLYLFLNNGTPESPSFILADDDFAHVSQLGLIGVYPAFDDLDGDNDLDLLLGNSEGDLWIFTNVESPGQIPVFENPLPAYQNLAVEGYSTPAFVDINKDGLNDLVLGALNGKLSYYENTGIAGEPVFSLITNNFGNVNVTDPRVSYTGYSVPCFFMTSGGELRLLAGSESGLLKYYKNISADAGQVFELYDPHFMYITEGIRTAPAWSDLNNNGFPDLAVGNYSGGITLFEGTPPGPAGFGENDKYYGEMSVSPNPGNGWLKVNLSNAGTWQLNIYNLDGLLLKSVILQGEEDNNIFIPEPYSGMLILEARNQNDPRLNVRNKVVIIR